MANQEPLQESSYLTLGLKLTSSIPLNDEVSKSPTKNNEPKAFYLFGTRISVPLQEDSLDLTSCFSTSPTNTDQNSKTLSEDSSLISKATSTITFTDVSMSPTKKNEPKVYYLFGTRISQSPQESSSLTSTATLKRSRTMSLLGHDCLDPIPKEMSLFSTSSMENDENPKEESKEDARKIKKTRHLSKEENRAGSELDDLNIPQRTISKTLTPSDVNGLSRLLIETSQAESQILRYMSEDDQRRIQEGDGVKVKAYDHDTGTEHDMVFKRWIKTSRCYLLNGGWRKQFVWRRDLKVGDKIGLFWDDVESKVHFCVLFRATANQENTN